MSKKDEITKLYFVDREIPATILSENGKELNYENFIKEYDPLQTMYGKEGVIVLARRYVEQRKNKNYRE